MFSKQVDVLERVLRWLLVSPGFDLRVGRKMFWSPNTFLVCFRRKKPQCFFKNKCSNSKWSGKDWHQNTRLN